MPAGSCGCDHDRHSTASRACSIDQQARDFGTAGIEQGYDIGGRSNRQQRHDTSRRAQAVLGVKIATRGSRTARVLVLGERMPGRSHCAGGPGDSGRRGRDWKKLQIRRGRLAGSSLRFTSDSSHPPHREAFSYRLLTVRAPQWRVGQRRQEESRPVAPHRRRGFFSFGLRANRRP